VLKIYSPAHRSYVHLLRLPGKIFDVAAHPSSRFMVVCMESDMHVYSTPIDGRRLEFQCVWSARIMPNPSPHILAALSQGNVGPAAGSPSGPPPLVNLGPNAAALLSSGSFSRDEAAVIAVSRRWIAYCPAELPQQQHAASSGLMMAHYAAVESNQHDGAFVHKSPLFQPLQPTGAPSSSSSAGGGGSSSSSFLGSSLSVHGESLSNVASGLASKLYNMAGQSKKIAANYLSGEDATGQSVSLLHPGGGGSGGAAHAAASSSVLGTVLVRDMDTQRIIACIRAHPNTQVTHLSFDRSGTLLATAPVDGQYVHVYAVVMVPQPSSMAANATAGGGAGADSADLSPHTQPRRPSVQSGSPLHGSLSGGAGGAAPPPPPPTYQVRFLYRLFRGITHASIRCISFSLDSRFLTVLSSKGTAHIYAINPLLGGDISALTHGPGTVVAAHENSLNQQLVAKYEVLQQQQIALTKARAAGGAAAAAALAALDRGPVGLDVFLSQPKTLSSIYRLKPKSSCRFHTPPPAVYTPVIAAFARLPQSEAERSARSSALRRNGVGGELAGGTADEESPLHHLLVCGWNEDLSVYGLSTAYQPGSQAATASASAAATGRVMDADAAPPSIDAHAKLTLLVQNAANFDLQPTALSNANSAAEQQQQHHQQQQQPQSRVQPHQQQLAVEQQQTVRYLTQRGQEDEPSPPPAHARAAAPALPFGFFVDLEPERFGLSAPASSSAAAVHSIASPSGGLPSSSSPSSLLAGGPISIPRSALSTHSPIFAAIAPGSVTTSPILQGRSGAAFLAQSQGATPTDMAPLQLQQQAARSENR
jgi:hypothetical protein